MTAVLVDTSVWIDYFRGGKESAALDRLLDDNLLVTNAVILAELIPFLTVRGESRVVALLESVECLPLRIDWQDLVAMQVRCLRQGSNGIGIPDLIIAQNALQSDCPVYSLDRHFRLLAAAVGLRLLAGN